MKYTFVTRDGAVGHTLEFNQAPPALDPSKGRWLIDAEPDHDRALYACTRVEPVPNDAESVPYLLTPVSMELAVEIANSRVNDRRQQEINTGFVFRNKLLDSDSRSTQNILTAATAAQIAMAQGIPFVVTWTCADNTTLELDAQGVVEMMVALAHHIDDRHAESRSRKQAIRQAATITTNVDSVVAIATL